MTNSPFDSDSPKIVPLTILGTGAAGLALALKCADQKPVLLIAKEGFESGNSPWAQGGIAAVMSEEDSFSSHIQDTLIAGAGLCKINAVQNIIKQAPERIMDLVRWGVQFDLRKTRADHEEASSGTPSENTHKLNVDLTREGGHSFRRILHFEDQTGLEIHRSLLSQVRAHPQITLLDQHIGIDLIINKQVDPYDMSPSRVVGVYVLNKKTVKVLTVLSQETVLATGGAGKVYLYTSNWSGATGDGIAMAYRAGARVANLEFMQFHPTCLYHQDARNFLITEAMRGEGGELVDRNGNAFMKKYHPLGSLAPRDIVARSIDAEMKKSGAPCVFLDIRHKGKDFLNNRFPMIAQKCKEYGIDISTQPIPVVPAAHYLCGGVLTDVTGKTDLPGLSVIGESACTGLHGANRLASNSLLECLAMAHNCAQRILKNKEPLHVSEKFPKNWIYPTEKNEDELIVITHMWEEIRHLMWNYVGIVRSTKRLLRAKARLKNILSEVTDYYSQFAMNSDILELRNIAIVADLTVECALRRKESRGIHYSLDYPPVDLKKEFTPEDSIMVKGTN